MPVELHKTNINFKKWEKERKIEESFAVRQKI